MSDEGIILPPSSGDHVTISGGLEGKTPHVEVEAEKDLGKPGGWAAGGKWEWVKGKGQQALGYLTWRPKAK